MRDIRSNRTRMIIDLQALIINRKRGELMPYFSLLLFDRVEINRSVFLFLLPRIKIHLLILSAL
jgi:hypothetical protein